MNTKLQFQVPSIDNEAVVAHRFLAGNSYQVITTLGGENALNTMVTLKAVNDAEKHSLPEATTAGAWHKTFALAKAVTMFICAPLIALAYIIALPFIGLYQIAKLALEAYAGKYPSVAARLTTTRHFLKNVGLFLVSPFIALGYVFALPFVGFYMFTKLVMEAQANKRLNA